jgi:hypothetical protein
MIVLCVRWCLRFSPSIRDLEDLISDGLLDLAVCTNSGSTYDSSLYFYAGMGNGEFQPPVLITAGPTSVAAGDLNGDGLPDLAGANPNNSGSIQVYLSNGNGTFQPQSNYSLATHNDPLNNELSIAIADVNKDGQPDIVNGTYQYPGVLDGGLVTVLPGNGDGAFGATITSLQGEEVSTMTLADFDGDGYPDVAFVGYNNAVSVALNNGTGKFESAVYQVAQYARTVLVGQFQGTSRLDLALLDSPNLRLYPGAANGTFGQPLSSTALATSPQRRTSMAMAFRTWPWQAVMRTRSKYSLGRRRATSGRVRLCGSVSISVPSPRPTSMATGFPISRSALRRREATPAAYRSGWVMARVTSR